MLGHLAHRDQEGQGAGAGEGGGEERRGGGGHASSLGSRIGYGPDSGDDHVVIAENGGSALLYLPGNSTELTNRLLDWLNAQEWVGAIATVDDCCSPEQANIKIMNGTEKQRNASQLLLILAIYLALCPR